MTRFARLSQILCGAPHDLCRREGDVWRLEGSRQAVEVVKRHLLEAASESGPVFVHYDDQPPPGLDISQISVDLWLVPKSQSGQLLLEWLYMGNWVLYPGKNPISRLIDFARASAESVSMFVEQHDIPFLIDSFHDDVSWTVAVRRGLVPDVAQQPHAARRDA
jgi:hypothetical protein